MITLKLNDYLKRKYSFNDIKFLNELINSGMPIKNCLDIISSKKTIKISNEIILKLDNGDLFEDIIGDYIPNNISKYFAKLIKLLGFNKTIKIVLNIIETRKKNIDSVISKAIYPLVLMFVSMIALIVFDRFGLDSIISLMSSFIDDFSSIYLFRGIFSFLTLIICISLILISVILILIIFFNKAVYIYKLFNKLFPNSIINTYFTNEFISLYLIIFNNGYKTKDALDIIKELDNVPISAFMADEISKGLELGDGFIGSFDNLYFDRSFSKYLSVASNSSSYLNVLDRYCEYASLKVINFIKNFTAFIQGASYIVIGFIIIFVYQLLFMPMQAITGF